MDPQEKRDISRLRSLEDNYDDEGSIAPTDETIDRAIKYVPKLRKFILKKTKIKLGPPHYYHSDEGSVDLLWENEKYRFLANVPADNKKEPTYYGKFPNGIILENKV